MELKILDKKEEPLLSRTRVESEILFEKATPSGQEVKSMLAKNLGKDEKLLDVRGIHTMYGLKKAKILCYAYENEVTLKRIKVVKKKAQKEEKKETKEETKKEEKVEAKQEKKEVREQKSKENKEVKQKIKEQKQEEKKVPEKKEQ